jgi:hypothetical protein
MKSQRDKKSFPPAIFRSNPDEQGQDESNNKQGLNGTF